MSAQDAASIWNEVLRELEKNISVVSFDVFVRPLLPVGIRHDELVLFSETTATKNVVQKNYMSQIVAAVCKFGLVGAVIIDPNEKDALPSEQPKATTTVAGESTPQVLESGLIPKFTFDSFVVGQNNQFMHAAAQMVADTPGTVYNPLFLYGGTGLGKTHIMHAIGNQIVRMHPDLKVVYVTSERFTNELIDAIRRNTTNAFRSRYRSCDVLMIDDIQFIANKTSTQEEFFHTFNDLYTAGKQVILTSDRPPIEINPLEERLRSRFSSGLLADVYPPDLETRIAILQKKAQEKGFQVPPDVIAYIAEQNDSNVRILEENLSRIHFHGQLFEPNLTVEVAASVLKDAGADSNEALSIDVIMDVVCKYYKVSKDDLIGKKKNKEIVYPRQMCIYLITEILSLPLTSIGQLMGGRDHTTVMYARNKIADDQKNNDNIKRALQDIRNMIYKR
ncbi:MAG: chromosomal replication initiator protein DnaA [Clostridiales bacterium]|jgi:chromosomal replication initiator protein|nr:chromosomal replication initiator protein DnaA [Clostridiales bacterium]